MHSCLRPLSFFLGLAPWILAAAVAAQPTPTAVAVSGEFAVSQTAPGGLGQNDIDQNGDDGFVVVWESTSLVGDGDRGIAARRFDDAGQAVGGQFLVNSFTEFGQYFAGVSYTANGEFLVTWNDSASNPRGQRFAADGSRLGAEFNIDGGTSGGLEEVRSAARVDGSFAVAWATTSGSFPDASPVAARLFQPDATPATAATQVNTATEGRQFEADITALVNGQFLVAWSNLSASGDELSVRSLTANGLPVGSQTQVTQASQGRQAEPSLSADRADRSVLVWNDSRARILARRIDSSGALLGSEFEISQGGPGDRSTPSVATFRDGGFVVVWTDTAGPVPEADGGIVARVFDRNDFGGPAFVVNAQTSGTQRRPSVVADSRGRFRVSWGTDGQEIAARSFQSTTQIQTGQLVSGRTFSRSTGEHWVYYTFQVPAGQTSLVATLSDLPDFSPNDADLYLRQGAPPTELVSDCSSTFAGNSLERCVIANPIAGEWWVGVRGWSGGAVDFKLFVDLPFFSDDFESGSTSGWSSSSP